MLSLLGSLFGSDRNKQPAGGDDNSDQAESDQSSSTRTRRSPRLKQIPCESSPSCTPEKKRAQMIDRTNDGFPDSTEQDVDEHNDGVERSLPGCLKTTPSPKQTQSFETKHRSTMTELEVTEQNSYESDEASCEDCSQSDPPRPQDVPESPATDKSNGDKEGHDGESLMSDDDEINTDDSSDEEIEPEVDTKQAEEEKHRSAKNQCPPTPRPKTGRDHYNDMTVQIERTAKERNQVAITISEPTLTFDEERQMQEGKLTPDEHIDSWTKERIQEERTWLYVDTNYDMIYVRYYMILALADRGGVDLLENNEDLHLLSIPVPDIGKVTWTRLSSRSMQRCILFFLRMNESMWKVQKYKRNEKTAFTHLVAITKAMYHIDHWHDSRTATDTEVGNCERSMKDLLDIGRRLSTRWTYVLALSNERIGQDVDGRKGLLLFMEQLEENWEKSHSNEALGGQFQFRFQSRANGLLLKKRKRC